MKDIISLIKSSTFYFCNWPLKVKKKLEFGPSNQYVPPSPSHTKSCIEYTDLVVLNILLSDQFGSTSLFSDGSIIKCQEKWTSKGNIFFPQMWTNSACVREKTR